MYQVSAPPQRIPVGGIVFGALGLVAFVVSLLVPWYNVVDFTGDAFEDEATGAFAFGLGSAFYLIGVVLVAGFAVATLLTHGAARTAVGLGGLTATAVPTVALVFVTTRIHVAEELTLARAADIDRETDPDIFLSLQIGPVLGGVAVLVLAVAVIRFTWPSRPTAGYAAASDAAMALVLAFPWANREVIFPDRVRVQEFWFVHFGVLGAVGAFTAALALASAVLTVVLARRAWWPPLPGLVSTVTAGTAAALVGDDDLVASTRVTGATYVDDAAVNSGIPTVFAFAALVLFVCALVVAIRECRAARRSVPPRPQFLPSGESWRW